MEIKAPEQRAPANQPGYNDRLFAGGFRRYLHRGRFIWLQRELHRLNVHPISVFELGCFDGKTIRYLPTSCTNYVGADANWEGGLDVARLTWRNDGRYRFLCCQSPNDLQEIRCRRFEISICMETLEHLDADLAQSYLALMRDITTGYIFITVPNEKGIVFLAKHLLKRLSPRLRCRETTSYTGQEILWSTLGLCSRVSRREHKGFDYQSTVQLVAKYFDLVGVSGIPLRFIPPYMSFGVGIVGRVPVGPNIARRRILPKIFRNYYSR